MNKNYIDFHCHILPGMDFDGTDDLEESVAMCELLKSQGVATVCATPHFYPWNDDIDAFLERREKTLATLMAGECPLEIIAGAEIRIFQSLADYPIDRLCIGDSNVVVFELPDTKFENWMLTAIENTVYKYSLTPVIAHIERYRYTEEILRKFSHLPRVIFQVTIGELQYSRSVKTLDTICTMRVPVVLGSDAHNMSDRSPKMDIIDEILEEKAGLFDRKIVNTRKAIIDYCLHSQQILEKLIRTPRTEKVK